MDSSAYATFLRALGHRVVPTRSAFWYDANRFFFLSAPPHRLYAPGEEELRQVLRRPPCLGVRFATALESGNGKVSYQIVCDDQRYGLAALSGNVRSKVRRGLKRCEVGSLGFDVVSTGGRRAHEDTIARQGRDGVLSGDKWERFCAAAAATPGFEAWGAWTGGVLAAFLITASFDDGVEFLLARSCSDQLGNYPNNALIFSVVEEMLVRRGVAQITFGLESLEAVEPLDEFKFSMGFRARPLRQRVIFHPLARALLRHGAVRRLFRRWSEHRGPEAVFWRKAAGLLRFAEEGGF